MTKPKRGYCYVAVNVCSDQNAEKSALSLRAYDKDANITIFTDQNTISEAFDNVVKIASRDPALMGFPSYPDQGILAKARHIPQSPYEYTIFSDYDIHYCGDISDVFELLEYGGYDFCAMYDAGEVSISSVYPEIPYSVSKFHLGILAYRNSKKVQALFSTWRELIIEMGNRGICGGGIDECTFTKAVYLHKDIRYAILPSTYCCRFIFPYIVRGRVKALHGVSANYVGLEKSINEFTGIRAGHESDIFARYEPIIGFTKE